MESKFLSCPNCEAVYIADIDYSKPEAKPGEPQRYISYCSNCDEFIEG
ncbi:hypothetical protein JOC76_001988 [Neobacillus cucumis]|nr:hypothetical protein [Neobacillus cucumis]